MVNDSFDVEVDCRAGKQNHMAGLAPWKRLLLWAAAPSDDIIVEIWNALNLCDNFGEFPLPGDLYDPSNPLP
jgi:hypothetical protein